MGSQSSFKEYFSPLQPLREIKIRVFCFSRIDRKERRVFISPFLFHAGAEGDRKLRYDKVRKAFYPPPPPLRGTRPCLRGRGSYNWKYQTGRQMQFSVFCFHLSVYFVPLRQAGRAKRRGWIVLVIVFVFVHLSVFSLPFSVFNTFLPH